MPSLSHKNHCLLMFYIALILSLMLNVTMAANKKNQSETVGAIDIKTFEILIEAQELTEAEQYNAAIMVLERIKNVDQLSSYSRSQIWNLYAYIYASQEQYRAAITAYKKVIAEVEAPKNLQLTAQYTIAQLYFQLEDYHSMISFMKAWLQAIEQPTANANIMLAQAYYQTQQHNSALKHLSQAEKIEHANGNKIPENWLRMKIAIYFDQKDTKNILQTYQMLFNLYPRDLYLRQIAGLHGEFGEYRKRLISYDALYENNNLQTESEILNLAYMYLAEEIPYKAAKLIESGMQQGIIQANPKNVETLANAWVQASEHKKAIPALEKAANLSDKGILYARLAGVYFDVGDFANAAKTAKKADDKGGLKGKENNQMILGIALFNLKRFDHALQAFRQAKQSKKRFKHARQWEQRTLSELALLQTIEASKLMLQENTGAILNAEENNIDAMGKNISDN